MLHLSVLWAIAHPQELLHLQVPLNSKTLYDSRITILLYGNFPYNLFLNPNISSITATFFLDIRKTSFLNPYFGYCTEFFRISTFYGMIIACGCFFFFLRMIIILLIGDFIPWKSLTQRSVRDVTELVLAEFDNLQKTLDLTPSDRHHDPLKYRWYGETQNQPFLAPLLFLAPQLHFDRE